MKSPIKKSVKKKVKKLLNLVLENHNSDNQVNFELLSHVRGLRFGLVIDGKFSKIGDTIYLDWKSARRLLDEAEVKLNELYSEGGEA